MSNSIEGKNIILSLHDGTAYRPVACLTSNGISITQEVKESPITKCSTTATKKPGALSYEIPFEGQFIDTTSVGGDTAKASYDWLLTHIKAKNDAGELSNWKQVITKEGGVTDTTYGEGIIASLELTAPADDFATFSASLQGNGWITTTDPLI